MAELHSSTKQLVAIIELLAQKTVNFVSPEDMTLMYKKIFEVYTTKPGLQIPLSGSSKEAQKLQINLNEMVMSEVKSSIDEFLSLQIDKKLRELDNLRSSSLHAKGEKAWRPPGDAMKHLEPFNVAAKLKEKAQLEATVNKERERLNMLKSRVEEKRLKAQELHNSLKAKLQETKENIKQIIRDE